MSRLCSTPASPSCHISTQIWIPHLTFAGKGLDETTAAADPEVAAAIQAVLEALTRAVTKGKAITFLKKA